MTLSDFKNAPPRSMPVLILADTSGSMKGEKIEALNASLRDMRATLSDSSDLRGEIEIALITFGGREPKASSLTPVDALDLPELQASGKTPLGAALEMTRKMIEDEGVIPSHAYSPTIVLVSDGLPTDLSPDLQEHAQAGDADENAFLQWEPLRLLHESPRSSRCCRLAVGIGDDANFAMLKAFVHNPEIPVMRANEARGITRFMQWLTTTILTRSMSRNPEEMPPPSLANLDPDSFL